MASFNHQVLYIDGFAGPGRYSGGEDGSPLLVLKAARDHTYPFKADLLCIFIEENRKRFLELEHSVENVRGSLPPNISVRTVHGTFDEQLIKTFASLDLQKQSAAPTFAFIDPFGFSHTPFSTVKRVLSNRRGEVLINFMYEEINRFLSLEKHSSDYDALFGTSDWRKAVAVTAPDRRKKAIYGTYQRQLETCAQYVHSFEMRNIANSTDYFLFFATNNIRGLEKMKEAMWRIDSTGFYRFSDLVEARKQSLLFAIGPDYDLLREMVLEAHSGKPISVDDLEIWVVSETPFLRSHLRRGVLDPLEKDGLLTIKLPAGTRKRGTYPKGSILTMQKS